MESKKENKKDHSFYTDDSFTRFVIKFEKLRTTIFQEELIEKYGLEKLTKEFNREHLKLLRKYFIVKNNLK